MSVLLPLYLYPNPGVWDPLYWAAGNNTNINFTVILNPCSGPCPNGLLEQPYLTEMPKLRNYNNIRTLGYVATNYTNKPIEAVIAEVAIYSNWTQTMQNDKMGVDGIFFDEVPGTYDWEKYEYLRSASNAVKGEKGLGNGTIVHNPGTIPGIYSNYLDLADITVVFEERFINWLDQANYNPLKTLHTLANKPKSALAIMLHSVPNIPDDLLEWTVTKLKDMSGWSILSIGNEPGAYWHNLNIFTKFVTTYAEKPAT